MPVKKHHIKLDKDERQELLELSRQRKAAAMKVQRAKAMLAMDCGKNGPGHSDHQASRISGLSIATLERLRKRVCEVGPLGALERKVRETPPNEPKITGRVEAHMVQIACSDPPEGFSRWTMQMIADRLVELKLVESLSSQAVRMTLKKTTLNRGNKSAGASLQKRMRRS
jgi:transposase